LADANKARAEAAIESGHRLTAQSNWLRAANYYSAAALKIEPEDSATRESDTCELVISMRACAREYLNCLAPQGEVVQVPWLDHLGLEAYFLPAPGAGSKPAPVVICIAESDQRKEYLLYKTARYARDRNMALLCVDLNGLQEGLGADAGPPIRIETCVVALVDYLVERGDIDSDRIAIVGDGADSSLVAKGVALDGRLAAAVCDGGLWELLDEAADLDAGSQTRWIRLPPLAWKISCPLLVVLGQHSGLQADRARQLLHRDRDSGAEPSFRIFEASETGTSDAQIDNPTLVNEFIFDWIVSQMAARSSLRKLSGFARSKLTRSS
jgi:hypothetical protein